MGSDVCLEKRYAILENGPRIDVVRFDGLQESAVSFAQLDIGECGFRDAGSLRILVGLTLRGGSAVLDNADENPPIGIEERVPPIGVSVTELTTEDGPCTHKVSTVTLFHTLHEIPDIFAAVGLKMHSPAGNDRPIEPADIDSVLIMIEFTFTHRHLAHIHSMFQTKRINLRGKR